MSSTAGGEAEAWLNVEVAYARPERQEIIALQVPPGTTVAGAIEASGIRERFPEIDLARQPVGVFGRHAELATVLQDDDRVEIYRPLLADPKAQRRERARRQRRRR